MLFLRIRVHRERLVGRAFILDWVRVLDFDFERALWGACLLESLAVLGLLLLTRSLFWLLWIGTVVFLRLLKCVIVFSAHESLAIQIVNLM